MANQKVTHFSQSNKLKAEQITAAAAEVGASDCDEILNALDGHFAHVLEHTGMEIEEPGGMLEDMVISALVFGIRIGWRCHEKEVNQPFLIKNKEVQA